MALSDYEHMPFTSYSNKSVAQEYLRELIGSQQIALLLGAGASHDAGLPSWSQLIRRCEAELGMETPDGDRSANELMDALDVIKRFFLEEHESDLYIPFLRKSLYGPELISSGTYSDSMFASSLFAAIGATVMAASRNSTCEVFTMNFDDSLECYLRKHNFRVEVVSELPQLLSGSSQITVYHPHGYIPLHSDVKPMTSWSVLGHAEFVARLAESENSHWRVIFASRLLTKIFLCVGTGMNDIDVEVYLARNRATDQQRPLGFVLDKDLSADRQESLRDAGIAPVVFENFDEIHEFLSEICRVI